MLAVPFVFVSASVVELPILKEAFRLQAARVNRGFIAGPSARNTLCEMAEALEAQQALDSTTPELEFNPTSSPLLLGRWYLDFTDAADVLSLGLLPFPSEIGDIYQEVRAKEGTTDEFVVDNAVEVLPVGAGALTALTGVKVAGMYSVEGACKILSPTRVSLAFVGGRVQPLAVPFELPALGGALPDPLVSQLQGLVGERVFLETTYV
jgi:hypothetical protein